MASPDGAGKINVSWSAPDDDGGAEVEQYCIVVNQVDEQNAVIATDTDNPAKERSMIVTDMVREDSMDSCTRLGDPDVMPIKVSKNSIFQVDGDTTMATFSGLDQESRWQFEVYALNDASDSDVDDDDTTDDDGDGDYDENGLHGVSATSDKQIAETASAKVPGAPQRLTAQLAKDTNEIGGIGNQGVLLLWNPPANPPGAPVEAYKIERSVDDGDFITRVSGHTAAETHWADSDEPDGDEIWTYRITAINDVGTGTEMATVMIPYPAAGHTHPPGTVGDASGLTTASGTAAGTAMLTWTEGDNANIHWVFGIAVNGDGSLDFTDSVWIQASAESPYTVTGLTSGKMYKFAIISGHYDASLTPDTRWSEWTWAAADVTVN